ncbi:hypothetical protein Mapa_006787 [Marchantia paleacea]|nr:hypothetical protein Mapa_006787 [Marchantia paleacea]
MDIRARHSHQLLSHGLLATLVQVTNESLVCSAQSCMECNVSCEVDRKPLVVPRISVRLLDADAFQAQVEEAGKHVGKSVASRIQKWTEPGLGCRSSDRDGCGRSSGSTHLGEQNVGNLHPRNGGTVQRACSVAELLEDALECGSSVHSQTGVGREHVSGHSRPLGDSALGSLLVSGSPPLGRVGLRHTVQERHDLLGQSSSVHHRRAAQRRNVGRIRQPGVYGGQLCSHLFAALLEQRQSGGGRLPVPPLELGFEKPPQVGEADAVPELVLVETPAHTLSQVTHDFVVHFGYRPAELLVRDRRSFFRKRYEKWPSAVPQVASCAQIPIHFPLLGELLEAVVEFGDHDDGAPQSRVDGADGVEPERGAPLDAALLEEDKNAVGRSGQLPHHGDDVLGRAFGLALFGLENEPGSVDDGQIRAEGILCTHHYGLGGHCCACSLEKQVRAGSNGLGHS